MANIDSSISIIRNARRGEEVRDAIINAMNLMNQENHSLTVYEVQSYISQGNIFGFQLFEDAPTANSLRAVTSRGLFNILTQIETVLDRINGEVV